MWSGRLAWDDGEVVPFASAMLRDRKRMFYEGAAVATVVLDDDQNLVGLPQVAVLGIADPLEGEADHGWDFILSRAVSKVPKKARRDDVVVTESVRGAVRKTFAPRRKPVVKVHIVRA